MTKYFISVITTTNGNGTCKNIGPFESDDEANEYAVAAGFKDGNTQFMIIPLEQPSKFTDRASVNLTDIENVSKIIGEITDELGIDVDAPCFEIFNEDVLHVLPNVLKSRNNFKVTTRGVLKQVILELTSHSTTEDGGIDVETVVDKAITASGILEDKI